MSRRIGGIGLLATLLTLTAGVAWGGADTVYQRAPSEGAITLTNVPDGDGYQVLISGSHATAGSDGTVSPVAVPAQALGVPAQVPPAGLAQAERSPEPAVPRMADTPPSIEARTGRLLDPEAAPTVAAALASQAQEQIASAGGAQARLLNLYQASMSAFAVKRSATPEKR